MRGAASDGRLYRVDPKLICKIESSADNQTWTLLIDDGFQVYGQEFRYLRVSLYLTGGMVRFSSIRYTLNVKKMTDFGHVMSYVSDNGAGFVSVTSTPDLYGTWVPFNAKFVDVQAGPFATVADHPEYTAYVNFKDVINPQGFRCWATDKNGNRVSCIISWQAFGA